jgi:hypothetical protein
LLSQSTHAFGAHAAAYAASGTTSAVADETVPRTTINSAPCIVYIGDMDVQNRLRNRVYTTDYTVDCSGILTADISAHKTRHCICFVHDIDKDGDRDGDKIQLHYFKFTEVAGE